MLSDIVRHDEWCSVLAGEQFVCGFGRIFELAAVEFYYGFGLGVKGQPGSKRQRRLFKVDLVGGKVLIDTLEYF